MELLLCLSFTFLPFHPVLECIHLGQFVGQYILFFAFYLREAGREAKRKWGERERGMIYNKGPLLDLNKRCCNDVTCTVTTWLPGCSEDNTFLTCSLVAGSSETFNDDETLQSRHILLMNWMKFKSMESQI